MRHLSGSETTFSHSRMTNHLQTPRRGKMNIHDKVKSDDLYYHYIELIDLMKEHPDDYKYSAGRKNLAAKCLANPKAVADLVFSVRSNRTDSVEFQGHVFTCDMRNELIFTLSQDDCRTCLISKNPQWGKFMREFIIPRMSALNDKIQSSINWYISVHGLEN